MIQLYTSNPVSNNALDNGLDPNGPARVVMSDLHDVTDITIAQIYPGLREPPMDMITARTGSNLSWYSIDRDPPKVNPNTPFPHPKLATTVKVKGTAFSLFHQINATTFAEDMWDTDAKIWKSTYIDVHTW